jgi:hypothetical protein
VRAVFVVVVALSLSGCFRQLVDEPERIEAILSCTEDPAEPNAFDGVPTPMYVSKVAEPMPDKRKAPEESKKKKTKAGASKNSKGELANPFAKAEAKR